MGALGQDPQKPEGRPRDITPRQCPVARSPAERPGPFHRRQSALSACERRGTDDVVPLRQLIRAGGAPAALRATMAAIRGRLLH